MHHVVVDPKFWATVEAHFPLAHDETLTSHDFEELELVEIQNRLRHDYYGDTRPAFLADTSVRLYLQAGSLVFERPIGLYCSESGDGIVRIIRLEVER